MAPRPVRIYSENNDFQHVETLRRNRVKRQRHREFFVEGVRPINLALEHGWEVRSFLYSREQPLSDWAEGILRRSQARAHLELPLDLLRKLSNKEETSELIAVVAMPPDDLSRIPIREEMLIVVFDRPASPGNLGTLLRSCDALGADGVVITGHAADVYSPETVSASTGSLFAVPVVRLPSVQDLLPWFETIQGGIGDFQIVGSSAKADAELSAHDLTRPTVLVVGNETWGLSASYRDLCDVIVSIPMHGSATSLNVACAASIMLYEVDRQRRARRAASVPRRRRARHPG
jgi:TrmH family RNA methyltransferase